MLAGGFERGVGACVRDVMLRDAGCEMRGARCCGMRDARGVHIIPGQLSVPMAGRYAFYCACALSARPLSSTLPEPKGRQRRISQRQARFPRGARPIPAVASRVVPSPRRPSRSASIECVAVTEGMPTPDFTVSEDGIGLRPDSERLSELLGCENRVTGNHSLSPSF